LHREGRPYVHGHLAAPNGLIADVYFIYVGHRSLRVDSIVSPRASVGWMRAATEVPFTIEIHPAGADR
jgi:hypothetical protein